MSRKRSHIKSSESFIEEKSASKSTKEEKESDESEDVDTVNPSALPSPVSKTEIEPSQEDSKCSQKEIQSSQDKLAAISISENIESSSTQTSSQQTISVLKTGNELSRVQPEERSKIFNVEDKVENRTEYIHIDMLRHEMQDVNTIALITNKQYFHFYPEKNPKVRVESLKLYLEDRTAEAILLFYGNQVATYTYLELNKPYEFKNMSVLKTDRPEDIKRNINVKLVFSSKSQINEYYGIHDLFDSIEKIKISEINHVNIKQEVTLYAVVIEIKGIQEFTTARKRDVILSDDSKEQIPLVFWGDAIDEIEMQQNKLYLLKNVIVDQYKGNFL
jgi:hypothetical protein